MPKTGKTIRQPKMVSGEGYCRKCQKTMPLSKFYEATNKIIDSNGFMSVCRECCNNLYDEYFSTYNNMELALQFTCRDLDVCFNQEALRQAQSHIDSLLGHGKKAEAVFGYYKSKLGSTGKNNTGINSFRYKDSDLVNDNIIIPSDNIDNQLIKVTPELIRKWGNLQQQNDIVFLEEQYQDWAIRYEVSSKAMELLVQEICYQQLSIKRKREQQQNVSKELKDLQDLMNSSALKPIQESAAMSAEFNTLGTWIKKFEQEEPYPEPDPELRDVDGIKKYIRVWFLGHMCKILGIYNDFSQEYEEELLKYTINFDEEKEGVYNGMDAEL
jgi:hypothetical protein